MFQRSTFDELAQLSRPHRLRVALGWWLVAAAGGCSPSRPEPEVGEFVEAGEHVEVWASEGLEVCGGSVHYMDRFVDSFRDLVGPRPEADDVHRFYYVDSEDWEAIDICPDGSGGCVLNRRTVYSRSGVPHTHELVHAEIFSEGHRFLEEGIAELFVEPNSDLTPLGTDVVEGLEFHEEDEHLPRRLYQRAAHFTRFAVDRHGIDAFLAWRDGTSRTSDVVELERAFEGATGESLEDALAAYEAVTSLCANPIYRVPLPWSDAATLSETIEFGCVSSDVLGPYEGEIFTYRALEITEGGDYDLELAGDADGEPRGWLTRCDARCEENPETQEILGFVYPLVLGTAVRASLQPGKHWIRLERDEATSGTLILTITRQPS